MTSRACPSVVNTLRFTTLLDDRKAPQIEQPVCTKAQELSNPCAEMCAEPCAEACAEPCAEPCACDVAFIPIVAPVAEALPVEEALPVNDDAGTRFVDIVDDSTTVQGTTSGDEYYAEPDAAAPASEPEPEPAKPISSEVASFLVDLEFYTQKKLKAKCEELGLNVQGTKTVLMERVRQHVTQHGLS
jgi:hypothetical protein